MSLNRIRDLLDSNKPAFGAIVTMPSPQFVLDAGVMGIAVPTICTRADARLTQSLGCSSWASTGRCPARALPLPSRAFTGNVAHERVTLNPSFKRTCLRRSAQVKR